MTNFDVWKESLKVEDAVEYFDDLTIAYGCCCCPIEAKCTLLEEIPCREEIRE